uniref:Uncharacterized protein n=1 Tax=viral metagenome TaxID=1070528 RepID=A0A6M3XBK2_9ZZZZ
MRICRSMVVRFSWKPHRLTLKSNPAIYHWLWYTFSFDRRVKNANEK